MWNEYALGEVARQHMDELRAEADAARAVREARAVAAPPVARAESGLDRALMLRQVRWRLLC